MQRALSDNLTCSRKSKCYTTLLNSQEFENVELLNSTFDAGKIKSVRIPDDLIDSQYLKRRRCETYFELLLNQCINWRFRLERVAEVIWPCDESKKKKAYILGKEYEPEKLEDLKRMRRDFSSVLWFSYRKNFPMLNYKLLPQSESFISDSGWGCMIRVCQMIFAECLKRHRITRKAHNEPKAEQELEPNSEDDDLLNYEIASLFLDSELDPKMSPYSIQNLCMYLQEKFKLKPGIWLKPSSVLFALQEIHKDFGHEVAPGLQMEIYIDSTMYVTQALKKVTCFDTSSDNSFDKAFADEFELVEIKNDEDCPGEGKSKVSCDDAKNSCPDVDSTENQDVELVKENNRESDVEALFLNDAREAEKLLKHKWKGSLVVFMLAKIGLDRPNPEYIPFIKDLLSFPESIGMIGGKPGLAYYIVGFIEDKLMYLDPHFVQESVRSRKTLKENMGTYFASSIKHVGFADIDTSVTMGFFIEDEKSFKRFIERFLMSCQINESFLGIELYGPRENTTDVESFCGDEDEDENEKVGDEDGFEMI